jgi:hypothetical protein
MSAMLIGLNLPTISCWEITGDYEGHTLTFVIWATDKDCAESQKLAEPLRKYEAQLEQALQVA